MRIPNISVSDNVTRTIRDLELKRFELDQQISTGQKIKLPEDDGLRVGRLIGLESDKSNLSQYKRNSSQAKEFLTAGHLNLDHLRQLNQRGLEIARVAGTELNKSAAETYGHEINELVEEALNRVNSSHRGTPLFAGNELKTKFGNSDVLLGESTITTISLNDSLVGTSSADSNRILSEGEQVIFKLNGREYIVEATKDGLTTSKILEIVKDLINDDTRTLDQSPRLPADPNNPDADFPWYRGYVRGGEGDNSYRNSDITLSAEISNNGDLVLSGSVGQKYHASVEYLSQWNPSTYFPEQVDAKIVNLTEAKFPGTLFDDLSDAEQEIIRREVFGVGTNYFDLEAEKLKLTQASFPGLSFDDLSLADQTSIMDAVFQNAAASTSVKFEILLNSKASLRFPDEYSPTYYDTNGDPLHPNTTFYDANGDAIDPASLPDTNGSPIYDFDGNSFNDADGVVVNSSSIRYPGWPNLQPDNQKTIWREAFSEYYNHGDLVFNLSDQQVEDLTGEVNTGGGNYTFQYYQDTTDINLPMTGYLKPMELSDDGVWRRSTTTDNDDAKITDTSFYAVGSKGIDEFDSLQIEEYIVTEGMQDPVNAPFLPVGAAPRMTWSRDVSVEVNQKTGNSNLEINHSNPWQRLSRYNAGDIVSHNGSLWESQINANFNRIPGNEGDFWKELPSDYSAEREDWFLEATHSEEKIFFLSPDGVLHHNKVDAESHTANLIFSSKNFNLLDQTIPIDTDGDGTADDVDLKSGFVKEVTYSVSQFAAKGSESEAMVVFDPVSQSYRLVSADEDGEIINGPYVKGDIVDSTFNPDGLVDGAVALHEGRYFVITDENNINNNDWDSLSSTNPQGGGAVLLANGLPKKGMEKTLLQNSLEVDGDRVSGFSGDIIFQRTNSEVNNALPEDRYFLALNNYSNVGDPANDTANFIEIKAHESRQGSPWSFGDTYEAGQIVYYKGSYFQALQDDIVNKFTVEDEIGRVTDYPYFPSDEFYTNSIGEKVKNDLWAKLSDEGDLNHVLSFNVDNSKQPTVRIPDPGRSGRIASSEAVVDSNGAIVGLRVLDGGSYFFGSNTGTETIPSAYHKALIDLDNGETLEADIIWEEDNATGSFFVSGFNLDFSEFILDENDQPIDNPNFSADNSGSVTTAEIGDTFSFATGSRTFLDHRDENGDLLNVSYLGGDESSKAMVGTDTDLNFLLDASNDGTKSLGEIVKSLIDLRDGLLNSSSSNFSQEVQSAELELIASEDEIVNKMGELSASLVRIETVNSHDEEYSLTIDKQISNDLEVDLSEAIMRLSRISMAYQAAMQVGSQMLNNSLLNYL